VRFVPKEVHFSDNFEKLVDKIQEGGTLFMELLDDLGHLDEKAVKLKAIEHEADAITHAIYQDLHTTFITPLDREDIYALANNLDNVMDMIEESATKMHLYKIKKPVPHLRELAGVLQKSIALMRKAIYTMRHRGDNIELILSTCVEINSMENEADQILRMAMTHLFEKEKNVIELIKCKEILEHIEEATDNCEDVSNIVEGIILKYG
jgi:uncharacterized protein